MFNPEMASFSLARSGNEPVVCVGVKPAFGQLTVMVAVMPKLQSERFSKMYAAKLNP